MTRSGLVDRHLFLAAFALAVFASGCNNTDQNRVQGYVEGEYVYVAAPPAGQLTTLYVRRGTWVQAGDPLFGLESTPERAARDEAKRRLAEGKAQWEDLKKGKRPTEI